MLFLPYTTIQNPKSFTLCNIQSTINDMIIWSCSNLGPCMWHQLGIGQKVRVEFKKSTNKIVALHTVGHVIMVDEDEDALGCVGPE